MQRDRNLKKVKTDVPDSRIILTLVRVGLEPVASGRFPLPPTHKLSNPWTLDLASAIEVLGSFPMRVVP